MTEDKRNVLIEIYVDAAIAIGTAVRVEVATVRSRVPPVSSHVLSCEDPLLLRGESSAVSPKVEQGGARQNLPLFREPAPAVFLGKAHRFSW